LSREGIRVVEHQRVKAPICKRDVGR
jgi:hypothetical protein